MESGLLCGHDRVAPWVYPSCPERMGEGLLRLLGDEASIDLNIVDAGVPPDPVPRFGCLGPGNILSMGDSQAVATLS